MNESLPKYEWQNWYDDTAPDDVMGRHGVLRKAAKRATTDDEFNAIVDIVEPDVKPQGIYGDLANILHDIALSRSASDTVRARAKKLDAIIYPPMSPEQQQAAEIAQLERQLREQQTEEAELLGQKQTAVVKQTLVNNLRAQDKCRKRLEELGASPKVTPSVPEAQPVEAKPAEKAKEPPEVEYALWGKPLAEVRKGVFTGGMNVGFNDGANGLTWADRETYQSVHRGAVERALKENKPVPESVLADCPDLAEKYAKKEPVKKTGYLPICCMPSR